LYCAFIPISDLSTTSLQLISLYTEAEIQWEQWAVFEDSEAEDIGDDADADDS